MQNGFIVQFLTRSKNANNEAEYKINFVPVFPTTELLILNAKVSIQLISS